MPFHPNHVKSLITQAQNSSQAIQKYLPHMISYDGKTRSRCLRQIDPRCSQSHTTYACHAPLRLFRAMPCSTLSRISWASVRGSRQGTTAQVRVRALDENF